MIECLCDEVKWDEWHMHCDSLFVQFSRSVVSDSLRPHESQHARPPCPSPTPGVHSDSRPSSQWCHLILCRPLLLLPPIPPSIRVFWDDKSTENTSFLPYIHLQRTIVKVSWYMAVDSLLIWDRNGMDLTEAEDITKMWQEYTEIYGTAKETLMYRTVFWTLWERERVGWFGRMALKHV